MLTERYIKVSYRGSYERVSTNRRAIYPHNPPHLRPTAPSSNSEVVMPIVDIVAIPCKKCERGVMYKSTMQNDQGLTAQFALVYSYHRNSIVFQGLCDYCGAEFQISWVLESLLHYKEVS